MYELKNLNFLTKPVKDAVEPYCNKMLNLHGDNIKSLYVYGSATSDEFIPKKSNINILVILERIDPPDLKKTLGKNYDVVLEHSPPHIHIEYQPKSKPQYPTIEPYI